MGFGRATELKCQLWNAIKGNPAPRLQQKGNSMLEPEMTDLYTKWAAELLDPLRDEVSILVKERHGRDARHVPRRGFGGRRHERGNRSAATQGVKRG
jgi:hypothetical protein